MQVSILAKGMAGGLLLSHSRNAALDLESSFWDKTNDIVKRIMAKTHALSEEVSEKEDFMDPMKPVQI